MTKTAQLLTLGLAFLAGSALAQNVVTNGTFDNATGWTSWNQGSVPGTLTYNYTAARPSAAIGGVSSTGGVLRLQCPGDGANHGAYTPISLVAGRTYQINGLIRAITHTANSNWLEFFIVPTVPQNGTDYVENTDFGGIVTPRVGQVSSFQCAGYDSVILSCETLNNTYNNGGRYTAPTTGTYYLLIKTGVCCGGGPADLLVDNLTFSEVTAPQEPVPIAVGSGSYASFPPSHEGAGPTFEAFDRPFYVDPSAAGRPIPTNDWWTDLVINQYGTGMWAYPLTLNTDNRGMDVFFPTAWNGNGSEMVLDNPIEIQGEVTGNATFLPADARALDWGDWTVTARMKQSASQYLDVTFGHGLPSVWVESTGVTPILDFDSTPTFFNEAGDTITLPATATSLGMSQAGRNWGLFLPAGTSLSMSGNRLKVQFPGAATYLTLSALKARSDLALFRPNAFAIPRNSLFSWNYSPEAGEVTTTWELVTEALEGTETSVWQGWIPHHYRNTANNLALTGPNYLSVRGNLRTALGKKFEITFPFKGLAPNIPAPSVIGATNDYSASQMSSLINAWAARTGDGSETYFGGKQLEHYARAMQFAGETGNTASRNTLRNTLRNALTNWFTYTPGETEDYFAYMPNYKGMVGFNENFRSSQFTDHHFHYGYYTFAAGILGLSDPAWIAQYGGMAKLVARDYANWDRSNTDYPYLRCFDIWKGHSLADGVITPAGNNQESTSEAINSWVGMFFLGQATHDEDLVAAGAMGYAVESAAVLEYWFDYNDDVLAPSYTKGAVGILYDRGPTYGTFFSSDPAWIYGIQWIPGNPVSNGFFLRNEAKATQVYNTMLAERQAAVGNVDIGGMGSEPGNLLLQYRMMYDPQWVTAEFARLRGINSPTVTDVDISVMTYYYAHSLQKIGKFQTNYHMSNPMSSVFHNSATNVTTYVAWNAGTTTERITVYEDGAAIGCFDAAPGVLTAVTELEECGPSTGTALAIF